MTISSSIVLALALAATVMAVLRLVDVHEMLSVDGALLLTDKGSRTVFAFATHYFFSVFVLSIADTSTESSVLLEIAHDAYVRTARLLCFSGVMLLTVVFFM
jgi:phosphoribosylpyrophosphate synthetase